MEANPTGAHSGGRDSDPGRKAEDEVFEEYADRINRGETLDTGELRNLYPEFAERLIAELELYERIEGTARGGDPREDLASLGDYSIRRQIGRGGMGVVYEAWQNSLDRRVALKVLPAGIAADDKAFNRFMREAKTAAKLGHPHIVSVYGMGFEQNTPYYTMEFVEGETLAQLLAKLKRAETDADTPFGKKDDLRYFGNLAEVFAAVADGLQHAHSRGITHRDIKPSNLILDRDGRLRILDFGLAHLEGQDSLTVSGEVVGTPLYMSPEQARRRKVLIDHRTDIYSLGATLYEVLSLRPPFQGRDHGDTLSQIIAKDPAAPRRLNHRVPRDIETIVLKCIRKDPQDRYGTAEALAQDLRRFVRGDPIEARPQTGIEKLSIELWRRRWALGTAALAIVLALIGFAAATFVIAGKERRTQAALDEASKSFHSAHQAVESFLTLVAEGDLPLVPGREKERRKLLESAFDFYQQALQAKGGEPFLLEEAARASLRVGKVYRKLGERESAHHAYKHAVDLALELVSARPGPDAFALLRDAYDDLGIDHMEGGRLDEGRGYLEKALDVQKQIAKDSPLVHEHHHQLASMLSNLGITYVGQTFAGWRTREDIEKARDLFEHAAREEKVFLEAIPHHPAGRLFLSIQLGNLGAVLQQLGDHAGSEERQREGLELLRQLIHEAPGNPEYHARLASHALSLGNVLQFDAARPKDAEALYREVLAVQEKLTEDFPETPDHHSDLGALLNNLAMIVMARDGLSEAGELLDRAVREQEAALKASPKQPDYRMRLVQHNSNLAELRGLEGNLGEAEACHTKLIALQESLVRDFPRSSRLKSVLAHMVRGYAKHLGAAGRKDEASKAHEKALELREKVAALSNTPEDRRLVAESLNDLAQLEAEEGDLREASHLLRRAAREYEAGTEEGANKASQHEVLGGYLVSLGETLLRAGAASEAEEVFRGLLERYSLLAVALPEAHELREKVEGARTKLAIALMKAGRIAEGDAVYREALANLESFVADLSASGQIQNHLGDALKEYSGILIDRGDLGEARNLAGKAVFRFEESVRLGPGDAKYEQDLREGYAQLASIAEHLGDHSGAAEQARALGRAVGAGPEDLYRAAVILARAVHLAEMDPALEESDRTPIASLYVAGAVELLRHAVGKGLGDLHRLRAAGELAGLRGEKEFEALLEDLRRTPMGRDELPHENGDQR